jgi:topoisomerase-4 subunit A
MYKDWFLTFLCNLEAVPAIEDGFKPVQRRIMHSLKSWMMAVIIQANVVGHTMQYHPGMQVSVMQWYRLSKRITD